jgi:vacuolar protein sorting-associated protein 18
MFIDPLGLHAIITLQTGSIIETVYVDSNWKKARPLTKLKGLVISSIAWPTVLRAHSVRDALLGTDKGALLSLSIEKEGVKESVTPLCTLPGGQTSPIAGLAQVPLPSNNSTHITSKASKDEQQQQKLVLALCGTHLHLFQGGPTLTSLFAAYDPSTLPCKDSKVFDLPIEQGAAQLQLLCPPLHPEQTVFAGNAAFWMPQPTEFAILSTSGVYYGHLNLNSSHVDELDHLKAHKLLPASILHGGVVAGGGVGSGGQSSSSAVISPTDRPLSLALTQHHLVLLYPSRLQFINRISKRPVQEIPLEHFATPMRGAAALPLGLCRDALAGRVIVLAGDDALEVDTKNEDRDMWQVFLDRGEYSLSLPYCRTAAQRNAVYLAEADSLLADGHAVAAAERYGKVTAAYPAFEDLALRLMEAADPIALRSFLVTRLGTLGPDDKAQATMVATWLLELLLDSANRAALGRNEGPAGAAAADDADQDVQRFLIDRVEFLDPGTVVTLLEEYGRADDLLTFARARGDHETVLELLVQRREAERAIEVLRKPSVSPELAYRYAPSLVSLAPAQTVQAWIEASPPLDSRRLLPALLHLAERTAPPAARAEALRYVRHCVDRQGCVDTAVHNFIVALLAGDSTQEHALLDHLTTARDVLGRPLHDPVHALRLSQEWGRHRATVELLCEVGLWEDALDLALKSVDQDLAVAVARRPASNSALTRKLWLAIARQVVGKGLPEDEEGRKDQVREVSKVLDESRGAVHIEDVLPLFPDFVEIGAFRDAICASLERYNEEMESLRSEMTVATRTAAALRESLEKVEGRAAAVDLEGPCAACSRALHLQPPASAGPTGGHVPRVFVFPTGNCFHGSCLCAEAAALAPPPQRLRIEKLAKRLAAIAEGASTAPALGPKDPAVSVAELQRQLEDEIAVEDPFCGEIVVRHLTKPFILPEEAAEAASWTV